MFQFFPATQIHLLTRKDLEKLFIEANEQITPIEERKRALEREAQDMEVEIARRQIQRENNEKANQEKKKVTPLSLKAAERRLVNVSSHRDDLLAELEKQNLEIEALEAELARLKRIVNAHTTIPRDSKLIGPFNNSTLRRICSNLEVLAEGEDADGDLNLCLNILSCDSTLIAEHLHLRNQMFNDKLEDLFAQIQDLLDQGKKMKEMIAMIKMQMEHLTKETQRENKQADSRAAGEDEPPEEQMKQQETLSEQKNHLEKEIEELETKLTRSPLEGKDSKESLTLIRTYKSNASAKIPEIHRLEMLRKHHLMEISDFDKGVLDIEGNMKVIDDAINEMKGECKKQQMKIDTLNNQGLTSEDVSILMEASKSTTVFQMLLSNKKLRVRNEKTKAEKNVVSERVRLLKNEIKEYDEEIAKKERVLQEHE